ncbi:hypothetical protein A9Q86_03940 [Flavobacteriales bacterium 33_180_T64]|nr:hypothetical protein A9Q86_03940 [Flavobacteriales bacterium 33_180_T64]
MKKGICLVLLILTIGCKKKTDKIVLEEKKEENIEQIILTINFNFKTSQPDVFKIMMNNIEVDELQKKNIHIFEEVVPSTSVDVIIAKFDADNFSKNIVFHLGNKTPKEVEVESILVAYGKNRFNINSAQDLNKYFAFNKFIERDSTSKILNTKRVDGKLNPTFRIKRNLINLLKKE